MQQRGNYKAKAVASFSHPNTNKGLLVITRKMSQSYYGLETYSTLTWASVSGISSQKHFWEQHMDRHRLMQD